MTLGVVHAVNEYGRFRDWISFYRNALAGRDAEAAFEEAFGASLPEFYDVFEAWAAGEKLVLHSAAFESCTEASRSLLVQGGRAGVDAGYPDFRVPLESDHDGDGIVCEGYSPLAGR